MNISKCCQATIETSLFDGILLGRCSICCKNVARINPNTGNPEWLDGKSPWTKEPLRKMNDVVFADTRGRDHSS
jgi:hypothetical protein